MADGFIVRKGGVAEAGEPIPAPTITLVSKTDSSITFTLTNNSVQERDVTFGLTTPPTTTTITLAAAATSGNQTFSNLDDDTTFTIFAQAADGIIGQLSVTTDKIPVFTAATGGTTLEYDSGGKRFKSHTFTSNGNFVVSTVGDAADDRNKVDYLIIAGGGTSEVSFASDNGRGAGGAGGYRTTITPVPSNQTPDAKITVTASTFAVVVGSGGSSANQQGNNSSVFNIISTGGGANINNGGSGGGSDGPSTTNQGSGILGQGRDGGPGRGSAGGGSGAGGGGGAGSVGGTGSGTTGGNGGSGLGNILRTGSEERRGGGGGGGGSTVGTGVDGGGSGSKGNGAANTGGGGAAPASGAGNPGNGGSGIVIIRYEIATV